MVSERLGGLIGIHAWSVVLILIVCSTYIYIQYYIQYLFTAIPLKAVGAMAPLGEWTSFWFDIFLASMASVACQR